MSYAVETETKHYLPTGHFNNSVDGINRPQRWSEGEGHFAIEFFGTPEGVVGKPTLRRRREGEAAGGGRLPLPHLDRRRDPRDLPAGHGAAGRGDDLPHRGRAWSRSCASR